MNPLIYSAVLLLVSGAMAQFRPFYAGNGVQYPRPVNSGADELGNRFGESATDKPRVDQFGYDVKLVEDAAKAPEALKPFWYLNREQIQKHIGLNPQANQANVPVQAPTPTANLVRPQAYPSKAANDVKSKGT